MSAIERKSSQEGEDSIEVANNKDESSEKGEDSQRGGLTIMKSVNDLDDMFGSKNLQIWELLPRRSTQPERSQQAAKMPSL